MRISCEEFIDHHSAERFDVCIIGSGAAGMCIARELLPTGRSILLLEAGRHRDDEESQSCYAVELAGLPHPGSSEGRFRVPGGSTTRWGGQALPLDPIDFAARPWVPYSGWPIRYEDVEPFLQRAARYMLVDDMDFQAELARVLHAPSPGFDPEIVKEQFSKFSSRPDLRLTYGPEFEAAKSVTWVLGANVTQLKVNQTGDSISGVQIASYGGKTGVISASVILLCCGAIENARMLLLSNERFSEGIGNAAGLVGRFFQDHPGRITGTVISNDPDRLQRLFNMHYRHGMRYKPRFSATEYFQKSREILNISGVLLFEQSPDSAFVKLREPARNLRSGRSALRGLGQIVGSLSETGGLAKAAWQRFARRRHYNPGATIRLAISSEQEPDPESRVLLSSNRRDRLGLPTSVMQWRLSDRPARAIWEFSHAIRDEFKRLGIGEVVHDAWFSEDLQSWKDTLLDNNHHMGTTRMSMDPREGVVNGNCRVHALDNLFVSGSSVFPTGGHSNPTLTLLALSLRLADYIKSWHQR